MFKIGEFSRLAQVSIRMLRHYDAAGLLKPVHTDSASGYRFYSGNQLNTLHQIVFLRDAGFRIAEIADLLRNWDEGILERRLREKRSEAMKLLDKENEKITLIDKAIASLEKRTLPMDFPVTLKSAPSRLVASLRRILPDHYGKYDLWKDLYRAVEENGLASRLTGEHVCIFHDEGYKESDVDLEACVMLGEGCGPGAGIEVKNTEPIERMVCVTAYGPYENCLDALASLASWLQERDSFSMLGFSRQICHVGPQNESDPDKYVTEIQIPVAMR